jgi:hypothetical protein
MIMISTQILELPLMKGTKLVCSNFPLMVGNKIVPVSSAKNMWNLIIMSNKLLMKKLKLRWLTKRAVRGTSNTTPTFLY